MEKLSQPGGHWSGSVVDVTAVVGCSVASVVVVGCLVVVGLSVVVVGSSVVVGGKVVE